MHWSRTRSTKIPDELEREQKDIKVMIETSLEKVSAKYKEVLLLRYYEDMDYKEIAEVPRAPDRHRQHSHQARARSIEEGVGCVWAHTITTMDHNEHDNLNTASKKVLDKIRAHQVTMRPRLYFTFKSVAVAMVTVLTLLLSVSIGSFILYSIRTSYDIWLFLASDRRGF